MSPRILLAAACLLGAATLATDHLFLLFHPPSALLVLGVTLGGSLWSTPWADMLEAFRTSIGGKEVTASQSRADHEVFSRMAHMAAVSGLIGVLLGLIQLLRSLADPSAIGPALVTVLLSLLYSLVVGELCLRSMAEDCLSRVPVAGPED